MFLLHIVIFYFFLFCELPCPFVVEPEFKLQFFVSFCFPFLALGTKSSILPIQAHHTDIY